MSTDATPTPAPAAAPAPGGEAAVPVAAAAVAPPAPAAAAAPVVPDAKPGETAPVVAAAPVALDIKIPEGFVPGEGLDKFKALAAESGLKPEAAQKVFDLYVAQQQAEAAAKEAQRAGWVESLKADKELGGANFDKTLADAGRFMTQFGDSSLKDFLNESGLGDHPGMVRLFALAGRALAEDSITGNGTSGGKPDSTPEAFHKAMYPTMFKE